MMWYTTIRIFYSEVLLWNTSWRLTLVTFARAQRTAVAANARHLVSPLARQAAELQTSSAKILQIRKASNYLCFFYLNLRRGAACVITASLFFGYNYNYSLFRKESIWYISLKCADIISSLTFAQVQFTLLMRLHTILFHFIKTIQRDTLYIGWYTWFWYFFLHWTQQQFNIYIYRIWKIKFLSSLLSIEMLHLLLILQSWSYHAKV